MNLFKDGLESSGYTAILLGRALGADNDAVFGDLLGVDSDRLATLRAAGVV